MMREVYKISLSETRPNFWVFKLLQLLVQSGSSSFLHKVHWHSGCEFDFSVPDVPMGKTRVEKLLMVNSFPCICVPTEVLPTPCCYLFETFQKDFQTYKLYFHYLRPHKTWLDVIHQIHGVHGYSIIWLHQARNHFVCLHLGHLISVLTPSSVIHLGYNEYHV